MKSNRDNDTQSLTKAFQDYQIATGESNKKPPVAWRLWVPLLIQTGLMLSIPAQPIYTHLTGKTAVLQTVPVDPYDPFRGYSVTLNYDISRPESLQKLPGWAELVKQHPDRDHVAAGTNFYVILQQQSSNSSLPTAWKPVGVSSDRPTSIAANQVAVKGRYTYGSIAYGLETYYIPEAQREQINKDINQAQQTGAQKQPIVVEIKVDAQGNAVPLSFWVRDRNYHF